MGIWLFEYLVLKKVGMEFNFDLWEIWIWILIQVCRIWDIQIWNQMLVYYNSSIWIQYDHIRLLKLYRF